MAWPGARESKLMAGDPLHTAERVEPGDPKAQFLLLSKEGDALTLKVLDLVPESHHLDMLPHIKEDPDQDKASQENRGKQIECSDLIDPRLQESARPLSPDRRERASTRVPHSLTPSLFAPPPSA